MVQTASVSFLCMCSILALVVIIAPIAMASLEDVDGIVTQLGAADQEIRLAAAMSVSEGASSISSMTDARLVDRLIDLMYTDANDSVRYEAERALRSIGGQVVGDVLASVVGPDAWQYEDWMRLKAVTILGDLGQFGVEGLANALGDPSPRVQTAAVNRLQKVEAPPLRAMVGLVRLLASGATETAFAAMVALEELSTRVDIAEVALAIVHDVDEIIELRIEAAGYLQQQGIEVDPQIMEQILAVTSDVSEVGIDFEFRPDMSATDVRPRPHTDFDVVMRFNVEDFGAKRDAKEDSLPAVMRALEAAKRYAETIGPCEVYFPTGRYHFATSDGEVYQSDRSMSLVGARDMIIDGRGSEIIINSPLCSFLTLSHCSNIVVRNFEIDYDPLPFTEGTVIGVDRSRDTVTVELFPGMPSPLEAYFPVSIMSIQLKDPEIPGRLKANVPNWYETINVEQLDERIFEMKLHYTGAARYFSKGDIFVQNARKTDALRIYECADIVLYNITAYSSPGLFIGSLGTTRLGVIDCNLLLKEGRHTTACADGLHLQRNLAPWIEGCRIEAQGDDGLNLYSLPLYVLDMHAPNKIELVRRGDLRVGDTLHHWDGHAATSHGSANIVELEFLGNRVLVTLDRDFPDMRPSDLVKQQMERNEYERDSRAQAFYRDLFGKGFVIKDNAFINCRRFSIQIQAHDGIIDGNIFEGSSSQAVALRNASEWPEGHIPYNIIVRNNVFKDNGVDDAAFDWRYGQLFVEVGRSVGSREIQNIIIENNTFSGTNRPVSIRNANGAVIRDNCFVLDSLDKLNSGGKTIRIERSENIEISGNVFTVDGIARPVARWEANEFVDMSGGDVVDIVVNDNYMELPAEE